MAAVHCSIYLRSGNELNTGLGYHCCASASAFTHSVASCDNSRVGM